MSDAAVLTEPMRKKPTREDVGIQPHGKLVEIYTAKSYRGIPVNDAAFKVTVNGFAYKVPAGKRCVVPYEVYQILKNARSRFSSVDPVKAQRMAELGLRTTGDGGAISGEAPMREETICDYEVELIREVSKREV